MKKRSWLGLTALAAIVASPSALAADLPYKAPEYVPVAYTWTGWYFGVSAGYSEGATKVDYFHNQPLGSAFGVLGLDSGAPSTFAQSYNLHPNSGIVGVQLGYNWQTGNWLFGIESDISYRSGSDSITQRGFNIFNDRFSLTATQTWVGTVRGRLGFVAANNWLLYATGGLAYGQSQHVVGQLANAGGVPNVYVSSLVTRTGWTVGGGWEWMWATNWSLGLEYLYVDLGSDTLSFGPSTNATFGLTFPATTVTFHDRSHIARVKLNHKFDWWKL